MAKRNYYWKDNGKADGMKGDVFIFSYQTSFRNLCDSGVDMGVTLFAVDMGVTHGRGKNRAKKNRAKSLRKRLAPRQRFA